MGHSANGLNTDLSSVMKGVTPSFYTRRLFTASAAVAASADVLQVTLEHDDGVIVYINGKEAARRNAGPENNYLFSDQAGFRAADVETVVLDLGPASDWLVAGENLIAVAYHNGDAGFKDGTSNVPDLDAPAELDVSLAISGGATLVAAGGPCTYLVGLSEPSGGIFDPATLSAEIAPWGADGFDDSTWLTGAGPLGYDTDSPADYVVGTDLSSMRGEQTSVYLRRTFNITSTEVELPAELVIDWDDGYIAYLNGREFSRGAMGEAGTPFSYDQTSAAGHGASSDDGLSDPTKIETISVPAGLLVEGENVLAFQLHNSSVNSTDLYLSSELRFASEGRELVSPTSTWNYFIGTAEPDGDNEGPGDFSDWIELHNRGASPVDLSGWSLSDSDNNPLKWKIPNGTTIDADGYLLVLADNLSALNGISSYLHSSFSLSSGGEDLLLSDASGEVVSSIPGGYPRQDVFHSYGLAPEGEEYGFFPRSTPGAANSEVLLAGGRADTPDFSIPGGFHSGSIVLALTSNTPSGTIYYTLDGSEPDTSSTLYTAPFLVEQAGVNRGVVIRARTFADGMVPSRARTNTYLIDQREDLQARPALIFTGDPDEVFFRPHGITTISGGRRVNNQWEARDDNDYNIPIFRGRAFERPIFMEYYYGDDTPGLRASAGIRLSSSSFSRPRLNITASSTRRVPWSNTPETKPSWNLYFRNEYGEPEIEHKFFPEEYPVDKFEQLRIRAGKNDIDDPFIRDEFMRRLFIEMDQEGSRGAFCSSYINGRLTGFYNLVERLREPFMRSHHNSDASWDVHQVDDVPNGDGASWDAMRALTTQVKNNPTDEAAWEAAMEVIDLDNWLDYWILNIYGSMWDWPNNNWVAAKERSATGQWRFYVWDAEGAFGLSGRKGVTYDTIGTDLLGGGKMPDCFADLYPSPEFKIRFADRVNRLFFNGGVLDDREEDSIPLQVKEECEEEFLPVKRGVTGRTTTTLNQTWFTNWVNPSSGRRSVLFSDLSGRPSFRSKGLWPETEPPAFAQHGGAIAAGSALAITNPNSAGTTYYTLDGTDPRAYGDGFGSTAVAYSSAIPFPAGRTELNSRVRLSNGTWSPLTTASFTVGTEFPTSANMNIAEVMYYPADANDAEADAGFTSRTSFEFIRLKNVGALPVDLTGARIADGIEYIFPEEGSPVVAPGDSLVIVEDREAFLARYGVALNNFIGGQYSGALGNSSDTVTLLDSEGEILHSVTYSDSAPWPTEARSGGRSLLLTQGGPDRDHSLAENWTASAAVGGMPEGIPRQVSYSDWREYQFNQVETADESYSGVDADPDGDGFSNFAEYVLGGDPEEPDSAKLNPEVSAVQVGGSEYFQLSARIVPGSGAAVDAQMSADLESWDATPQPVSMGLTIPNDDGSETHSFRSAEPIGTDTRRFFRLLIGTQ